MASSIISGLYPLYANDLEVEKLLIWETKIPFENEVQQSSYFSLMGMEWCLRFSFKSTNAEEYHVITLHKVIDGKVLLSSTATSQEQYCFSIKTFLKNPTEHGIGETSAKTANVYYQATTVWWSGKSRSDIFSIFPHLYSRSEIKVVCKFYGKPLSKFQLDIKKAKRLCWKSYWDKSIQVSSEVPLDFQAISSDFSDLLEKKILPDVKLECGGQTLQAHKSVLVARSAVFRAMFQNKMLESETGAIKIHDIDVTVLLKLLKFLYSGKPEDLSEDNTAELYEVADKYDVVSLKSACSYWIKRNLTKENCIKYLKMAHCHSDSDLKAEIFSFIVVNSSIMLSETWLTLSKELPVLANKVYQDFVRKSSLGPIFKVIT